MDYEKAYKYKYKEALELARDYYKANIKLNKADENLVLEDIFPELKESEDEGIRKSILNYFTKCWGNCKDDVCGVNVEDVIAWLEKQVEQKPIVVIPKFRIGDTMRTKQEAADNITGGMPVVISIDDEYYHCTNELIAIKDQDDYEFPPINVKQKPTDKIEPKFHEGDLVVQENIGT